MAMNKKEQAEFQALKDRDATLRAIAWPSFPRPSPMPIDSRQKLEHGYTLNEYRLLRGERGFVDEIWREGSITYREKPPENRNKNFGTGSRGYVELYATEQDAYRAAAFIVAEHFGNTLADIYAKCFAAEKTSAIAAAD